MPVISDKKREKISEQILYFLFTCSPASKFTSDIAKEIARDEEFIKSLLLDMQKKGLVSLVAKNSDGVDYKKRQRWRLSSKTYAVYASRQGKSIANNSTIAKDDFG